MKDVIKSPIEFILSLTRGILFLFLSFFVYPFFKDVLLIYSVFFLFFFVISIRWFNFYKDRLEITFLFYKIVVRYSNIESVIYEYRLKGHPIIKIKLKDDINRNSLRRKILVVLYYRFVSYNQTFVINLFRYLKDHNVKCIVLTNGAVEDDISRQVNL